MYKLDCYNIFTNHKPRPVLLGCELTEEEKKEIDYYEEGNEWKEHNHYFRYKGDVYDLCNFSAVWKNSILDNDGWQGTLGFSYFNGLLVKNYDGESVVVAYFYT